MPKPKPTEPEKQYDVDDEVIAAVKAAHDYVALSVRKLGRKSPQEKALLERLDRVLARLY